MDKKDIYELMDKFEKSNMSEIELQMHGVRVAMKKGNQCISTTSTVGMVTNTGVSEIINNNQVVSSENENNKINIDEKTIKAPLVGTFYRAPSPDDKPYVEVGSKVKKGDVIGIIEAMKLMNEITATEDGEITSIEIENGDMVEYDQIIMKLK